MSVNLLELFSNGIGKDFGPLAAQALGESTGATQGAIGSILPTLLSGLMKSGGTESGAASLLSALNGPQVNSGLLDNIAGLFSGGQAQNPLMAAGGPLLSMLFGGDKLGGIASAIASVAGIKSGSATSLLTMAAPLVFGLLKKHVGGNNLGAAGLQTLLAGQAQHLGGGKLNDSILGAAGLGSGASLLGGLGSMAKGVGTGALGAVTGAAGTAAAGTAAAAAATATAGKGLFGRLLPWLIAGAVGLFLLSQFKSCGTQKTAEAPKPAAPSAPVATTPAPAAPAAALPAPAPAAPAVALPAPVPAPAAVAAPELLKLYFDTGSTAVRAGFSEKIQAFADYAKSSPNTKIGISGFHDKRGNPEQNAELSKNRAKTVRDALIKGGVPEDRIILKKPEESTGGASNDQEARRVEVVVLQ